MPKTYIPERNCITVDIVAVVDNISNQTASSTLTMMEIYGTIDTIRPWQQLTPCRRWKLSQR